MDLDELIAALQKLREQHGNVDAVVYDGVRSPVGGVTYLGPAPHRKFPMIALHAESND